MLYDLKIPSSEGYIENVTNENEVKISEKFGTILDKLNSSIYLQTDFAAHLVGLLYSGFRSVPSKNHRNINELLFSCFHKNLFTLHSATKLTSQGFYGTARPLIRNAYEWLIIAKFCNISEDSKVLEKWSKKESVYFSNSILKKIEQPNTDIFKNFWTMLSEMSHATKTSIQVTLEVDQEDNFLHVQSNLALIGGLLKCNYHLLNRHIFNNELAYYVKRYPPPQNNRKSISQLRKEANNTHKNIKLVMGESTISLVNSFKKKWILKT